MRGNVSADQAVTSIERPLSPRVQEALGELVGVAQEGALGAVGRHQLGVLTELMEEEVTEVVGPKGRHEPEQRTVRHGHEAGEVTLGGRRVGVERPRVRAADGTGEPVGVEADALSVSNSAISRTFIERTREALAELMARRLDDVRLAVLMLDGIELKGCTNVVALGITSDGLKIPLGL